MNNIEYKSGYKYQLVADHQSPTGIRQHARSKNKWLTLDEEGILSIKAGYAWDGPSGPALDTPSFMRASLVHDAIYQMMREKLLPISYRSYADNLMRDICIDDGMSKFRAWYTFNAVKAFAGDAADPTSRKPVIVAP